MILSSVKSLLQKARDPAEDPADRRQDPRRKVLLKAELYPIIGYADVVVKNVSRTGLSGETGAVLQVSQPLFVSLDGVSFHLGTVRWVRGRRFGLSLEQAFAIFGLEDEMDAGSSSGHQNRARRHDIEAPGRIALCSRRHDSTARDVSQSGLKLETDALVAVRQQVLIKIKDRPIILACVQWCQNGMVGVRTAERFSTLRLAYSSD
jgi:hypothetical protein